VALTVDDILERVRVFVRPNQDDATPAWYLTSQVAADALAAATNEIVAALGARGFTATQAQAWFRYSEYVVDLALWWIGVKAAAMNEERLDTAQLAKLDRRAELATQPIVDASGNPVVRANVPFNAIGHGSCLRKDETFRDSTGKFRAW
jgi:hypothetical protein